MSSNFHDPDHYRFQHEYAEGHTNDSPVDLSGREGAPKQLETFSPALHWSSPLRPIGPDDNPYVKLLGTVVIGNTTFHAEAYEVRWDSEDGQVGVQDESETYLSEILEIVQASASTITFNDREYVLAITPYQR